LRKKLKKAIGNERYLLRKKLKEAIDNKFRAVFYACLPLICAFDADLPPHQ
jgi:transcription initiation factor IIE alpha subunit